MNKFFLLVAVTIAALGMGSCATQKPVDSAHNSMNSLEWDGVYTGTIPAADGPGIEVTITLRMDLTYTLQYHYIDREGSDFIENGIFTWDDSGGVISLGGSNAPSYYRVGENTLTQLDMEGKPIRSEHNYTLAKQQ